MSRSIPLPSRLLGALIAPVVLPLLVLTTGVPAARATITPDAAKVVDRYVAAIGGRAAVDAERSAHSKLKVSAFGFEGTLEAWNERPNKVATRTALGPFTLQEGCDGATAWRIDQNGKFSQRDGKDLEDELGSAWYENGRWLDADQGGGSVTVLSSEHDSTGSWTVLHVAAPTGRAHDLWFNTQTGLLDRSVVKSDQTTVTSVMSDYRKVDGLLRPFRQESTPQGMPGNHLVATVESLWVNPPIDPARFAPPQQNAADVKFLNGTGPARVPMAYREKHVWVKASVNGGPPEDFILDTGASVSLLDSVWAVAHGIAVEGKMQAMGAGAAGNASFAKLASIKVAGEDGQGVEIGDQKVAVLALNRFVQPFFWHGAAGLLGYDFVSRFAVQIDFDGGTLTLNDPKTFKYAGKGTGIPITMSGSIPVVKAKLDGQYEGQFRIDVGSSSTVDLHGPFVAKHGLRAKHPKSIEVMSGGFGGTFTSHLVRMKTMQIGPYAWTDPLVVLSGAETGGLASEDLAGNIGNEILDRFICTLDYDHRMLYLEPGKRYAKPDRFTRAGVQVARIGDTYRAMEVVAGSAAAAAGIQEGDEVVSLDGKPIATYTQDSVSTLFERGAVGEKHTLGLMRDGKKLTLVMRLKTLI